MRVVGKLQSREPEEWRGRRDLGMEKMMRKWENKTILEGMI